MKHYLKLVTILWYLGLNIQIKNKSLLKCKFFWSGRVRISKSPFWFNLVHKHFSISDSLHSSRTLFHLFMESHNLCISGQKHIWIILVIGGMLLISQDFYWLLTSILLVTFPLLMSKPMKFSFLIHFINQKYPVRWTLNTL